MIIFPSVGKAFEAMGFRHVKTVLASGNVLFKAPQENVAALSEKIMQQLREDFGREIPVTFSRTLYSSALIMPTRVMLFVIVLIAFPPYPVFIFCNYQILSIILWHS